MHKQDIFNKITALKNKLKDKIIIPVHHYQSIDIVQFADFIGDSYKLAVECSKTDAEFIIFCGVMFMAEGAKILSKESQKVLIPEPSAGCPMAEMAEIKFVEKAYEQIKSMIKKEIAPVVYMNSYADLKSFCGEKGGSVCTSSNASKIFDYYFKQDKIIMFFPDYYLGINTSLSMNIEEKNTALIKKNLKIENQININDIKVFLWDGFCPVHQRFTAGDIEYLRKKYPGIKIIVHPECPVEVVQASDMTGSTEKIYKTVKDSPAGSVWGIGTETTFVERLAKENPGKTIVPLKESKCKNMIKNTPLSLLASLESVDNYLKNNKNKLKYEIFVNEKYKKSAEKALMKMIDITSQNS